MDVRFINPFLDGTAEVLNKMALLKPVAGKAFLKSNDSSYGDVSGVIGMTGDAVGSLALTFSEKCILGIVSNMLGETYTEINKDVMDTVGEITNMVSGASRKLMEKDNLKVFAAIPSIVCGKDHSVRHIIQGKSIVIPFHTESGDFVIDVCLQSQLNNKEEKTDAKGQSSTDLGVFDTRKVDVLNFNVATVPKAIEALMQDKMDKDLGKAAPIEYANVGEKIAHLKKMLAEAIANRESIMKELQSKPFMEQTQRQRFKNALPAYDAKIKRLKLDIVAAETIAKMSKDDFDNPQLKTDYQHFTKQKL